MNLSEPFEETVRKALANASDDRLAMEPCDLWKSFHARARAGMLRVPPNYLEILTRCMLDEQKRRLRG